MLTPPTNEQETVALAALAATLSDERRAQRFLDLTGLDADALRRRVASGDRSLLAGVIAFLEAHEPDLIAVADAIGETPARLLDAGRSLEQ